MTMTRQCIETGPLLSSIIREEDTGTVADLVYIIDYRCQGLTRYSKEEN